MDYLHLQPEQLEKLNAGEPVEFEEDWMQEIRIYPPGGWEREQQGNSCKLCHKPLTHAPHPAISYTDIAFCTNPKCEGYWRAV